MSIQTLEQLISKFNLVELPRSVWHRYETVSCNLCNGVDHENCDECDGGTECVRSENVNASRVLEAQLADGTFLNVTCFDSFGKPWMAVAIRDCKFEMEGIEKSFRTKGKKIARATSTSWDGQQAGSGIQRLPENIRGAMWRTVSKDSFTGKRSDSHVQPKCIVEYMQAQV